jgi:hypothetical protein
MIQWILHRLLHASSRSEIRVAELLSRMQESTINGRLPQPATFRSATRSETSG